MSYLVSNLEFLLKKHGINAYQLQDKSKIPQSTTFRIINGDTKSPSSTTVKKYADYFGVEEADLRYTDLSQSDGDNFSRAKRTSSRLIPVLNFVQAGEFCEYFDDAITDWFEPAPSDVGERSYYVVIEGFSMSPDYMPDDLALIDPNVQPNPGDCVVAMKEEKGTKKVTFKKWRPRGFDEEGVEYCELVPTNPDFAIIDSRFIKFEICGTATRHIKKLR